MRRLFWLRSSGSGSWDQWKGPLVQVKKGCAPSVEVAADASCREVKTQRQMEAQESVWSLLTQRHRRCQSDAAAMSRLRWRELHRLVQRKLRTWMRRLRAWTRRLRAWTWPGSPSQKVAGPDETSRFNATRFAQGWCKKPRVKTWWLRMWTWPDSSSVNNQRDQNLTTALDFTFKRFERRVEGR